jgi:hypothetical protein
VNAQSDHCFAARFNWFPGIAYPDQSSVEFWLNGAGEFILNGTTLTNAPDRKETPYLMEAEILSPLVDLSPGQDYHFEIHWYATRCPKPVLDVTPAGVVHERLQVNWQQGAAVLKGVFGVFHQGRAQAAVLDALGNVLDRIDLGPVEPNKVFRLNRELALPKGAFRVSVNTRDNEGQSRGWLGNALVPSV